MWCFFNAFVWRERLNSGLQNTVSRNQTYRSTVGWEAYFDFSNRLGNHLGNRVNTIWLHHVTDWVPLAVGPLLLARQLGTLCRTASVTWRSTVTVLDACWKRKLQRLGKTITHPAARSLCDSWASWDNYCDVAPYKCMTDIDIDVKRASSVWQTDRQTVQRTDEQTDRHYHSICRSTLCWAAKNQTNWTIVQRKQINRQTDKHRDNRQKAKIAILCKMFVLNWLKTWSLFPRH